MPTHVSDVLNIPRTSHSDIEFVDVKLAPDTKLFLDPCLIALEFSDWAVQANRTVKSYFDQFYSLYRNNSDDKEKLALFAHAHEINATHLGYGNGNNGKAKTPQGMLFTFRGIPQLMKNGIPFSAACDLPLFIKDFAEDCLSDMLTNILFKNLMDFTIAQCIRYNARMVDAPSGLHYWNADTAVWEEYSGSCLIHNGKLLLLVPKKAVRNRYYFTTEQYFRGIILARMKEESAYRDSKGKVQYIPKKVLWKKAMGNDDTQSCVRRYTAEDPSYLSEYHSKLPSFYSDKGMSDDSLDVLLYQ